MIGREKKGGGEKENKAGVFEGETATAGDRQ